MFAQKDGEDHDRQQEQCGACGDGGPVFATRADDGGDEGRGGLGGAAREEDREGVFVPCEDQAENRGGGDAGGGLGKDDFVEGLEAGVAVDQGCFFVFDGDSSMKPFSSQTESDRFTAV